MPFQSQGLVNEEALACSEQERKLRTFTDMIVPYGVKNSLSLLSDMSAGRLPTKMLPIFSSRPPLLGVSLSGLRAPLPRGERLLEREGERS